MTKPLLPSWPMKINLNIRGRMKFSKSEIFFKKCLLTRKIPQPFPKVLGLPRGNFRDPGGSFAQHVYPSRDRHFQDYRELVPREPIWRKFHRVICWDFLVCNIIGHFPNSRHFPIEQRTGSSWCFERKQAVVGELNTYLKMLMINFAFRKISWLSYSRDIVYFCPSKQATRPNFLLDSEMANRQLAKHVWIVWRDNTKWENFFLK